MMAGSLAMIAACVVFTLSHGFVLFAVAEVLAALSMTLCSGADSAYLFDLLREHGRGDEYPRREGIASAWHLGGMAFACGAGGVLVSVSVDLILPFIATAVVAAGAFLMAFFMREERAEAAEVRSPRETVEQMAESFRLVGRRQQLLWAIAYSALVFALLRSTELIAQPYLATAGFGPAQIGFLFAAVYLLASGVALRVHVLRRRLSEAALLFGLLGTLALVFLLVGR